MKLPIHNPGPSKSGSKNAKRRKARAAKETTTMATKKRKRKKARRSTAKRRSSTTKRTKKRRTSNPSTSRKRARTGARKKRRSNPSHHMGGHKKRRKARRRNPSEPVTVAVAAALGVGTAVVAGVAGALIARDSVPVQIGISLLGAAGGALLATKHPEIGGAIAAGSVGAVATPFLTQKVFEAVAPSKVGALYQGTRRISALYQGNRRIQALSGGGAPYRKHGPWGAATA